MNPSTAVCQNSIRSYESYDTWVSKLRSIPLVALEHPVESCPVSFHYSAEPRNGELSVFQALPTRMTNDFTADMRSRQLRDWVWMGLLFLDETWAKTNMTRRCGLAPRGARLLDKTPHGHWKTITLTAAFDAEGVDRVAGCRAGVPAALQPGPKPVRDGVQQRSNSFCDRRAVGPRRPSGTPCRACSIRSYRPTPPSASDTLDTRYALSRVALAPPPADAGRGHSHGISEC